jgi:hypothetical protein
MQKYHLLDIPLDNIRSWLSAHSKMVEKMQKDAEQRMASPLGTRQRSESNHTPLTVSLTCHNDSPAPIPSPLQDPLPAMPFSLFPDSANSYSSISASRRSTAPQTEESSELSFSRLQSDLPESTLTPLPINADPKAPVESGVLTVKPFTQTRPPESTLHPPLPDNADPKVPFEIGALTDKPGPLKSAFQRPPPVNAPSQAPFEGVFTVEPFTQLAPLEKAFLRQRPRPLPAASTSSSILKRSKVPIDGVFTFRPPLTPPSSCTSTRPGSQWRFD